MEYRAAEFIKTHDDFLLIAHVSPDGDALGSCLALYCALLSLGKCAQVVCEEPVPHTYRFLPHADSVLLPVEAKPAKTVIAVDCADILRTGACKVLFQAAEHTLCIDHHETNPLYADENFVEIVAATGELIFRVLCALHVVVDADIATCLYTALACDTGNFAYSNTTPDTFRIMAELLESGIDLPEVNRRLFRSEPIRKARLRARAIEKLQLSSSDRIGVAPLALTDFADCGATGEDNEGVIDAIRDIDTVEVAAVLRECKDGAIRVSLRAKHDADVSTVAKRFGGGGHRRAAGCTLYVSLAEAERQITAALSELLSETEC